MNWCEKHDYFKRTCPWCEIRELEAEIERLQEERDKLIEGLKYAHRFAKRDDLYDFDYVDGILKEIGVTDV